MEYEKYPPPPPSKEYRERLKRKIERRWAEHDKLRAQPAEKINRGQAAKKAAWFLLIPALLILFIPPMENRSWWLMVFLYGSGMVATWQILRWRKIPEWVCALVFLGMLILAALLFYSPVKH